MPIEIISALSFLTICVLYFLISKYIRFSRGEKTKKLVTWCFIDNSFGPPRPRNLFWYIRSVQSKHKLPTEYSISDEDRAQAETVLDAFKDDLLQHYFLDCIAYTKSIYAIPEEHFFMFRLFCFISNYFDGVHHVSWSSYEIISRSRLNNIDLTLYKLYYISYLFCKDSPVYSNQIAGWLTPEYFNDPIDERLTAISK